MVTVYTGEMESGDEAARARQRDLVRRGYDAISLAYRGCDGQAASASKDVHRYGGWVAELAAVAAARSPGPGPGCGAGILGDPEALRPRRRLVGVDFSAVQLRRARRLVPAAALVQADMAALDFAPASLDAVVSFSTR